MTPVRGARAIDEALSRWVLARTGSALLARAALEASAAEGQGHACARLEQPPLGAAFTDEECAALRAADWVGDGDGAPTAFVLDRQSRFYLWRCWRHEAVLADAIRLRCSAAAEPALAAVALESEAEVLFAGAERSAVARQREAVLRAVDGRLLVLTGGPGTGKTTTVVRLLAMLLRVAAATGRPAPSIALAAPTGKAARRLAQAIAAGRQALARTLPADSAFAAPLDAIGRAQARTLHRLLGYRPDLNGYARGAADPLLADVVVVDEASMIDLALMRQLFEALRPDARLILLGDPDQLASVDAGSVLADIVASAPALGGRVVRLDHVWRAGAPLQRDLQALRDADGDRVEAILAGSGDGIDRRPCGDAADLDAALARWIERHRGAFDRLFASDADPADALAALRAAQVLAALREGTFGAAGLNARIARALGARYGFDPQQTWHRGRALIVTRNDDASGLYNGDVGVVLDGADGPRVWFEAGDRDGVPALRSYAPAALPAHESAWAITIHRSQGSEYGEVAVVLPPDPAHPVLSRELVYTAVSRARAAAELWATPDAVRAALARPIVRHGGLRERLAAP